jgi:hypothetical protein
MNNGSQYNIFIPEMACIDQHQPPLPTPPLYPPQSLVPTILHSGQLPLASTYERMTTDFMGIIKYEGKLHILHS